MIKGNAEKLREYRNLSGCIQALCRNDKNHYINNLCIEIEKHIENNNPKELYNIIRTLTKKFKPRVWNIKDDDGKQVTDIKQVAETWRKYCEKLYSDPVNVIPSIIVSERKSDILLEIEETIRKLKKSKAPGIDAVTADVIKELDPVAIELIHDLCNNIWTSGNWPKEWTVSITILSHKKGSINMCSNYRTLSRISHIKVILYYILQVIFFRLGLLIILTHK